MMTPTRRKNSPAAAAPAWVMDILGFVAIYLVVLLTVSSSIFPQIVSTCGRLRGVPADQTLLSMNHSRLDLPDGAAWQSIEIDLELRSNEALSFIIDREGDDYAVLRLSREPSLDGGVLHFSGSVVDKTNPPWPQGADSSRGDGPAGALDDDDLHHLRFERVGGQVRATLDGALFAELPSPRAGAFEVVMYPPDSTEIHERVTLGEVLLDSGVPIPRDRTEAILNSPLFLLVVTLLIYWAFRRRLGRLVRRLFPYHTVSSPRQGMAFLLSLVVLLVLAVLIPVHSRFHFFVIQMRFTLRIIIAVLFVIWPLVFLFLRERLLQRFERLRADFLFHAAMVPVTFVIVTAGFLLLYRVLLTWAIFENPEERNRPNEIASVRVAVYGGSSTRGYPFDDRYEIAYPERLAALLEGAEPETVVAWNLGEDNADLVHIAEHLNEGLDLLGPTHIIINDMVNNESIKSTEESLDRITALLDAWPGRLYLVNEPTLPTVHQVGKTEESEFYLESGKILRRTCRLSSCTFVDPVPAFRAHRDEFLLLDSVHLSPRGHALMAEVLEKALQAPSQKPR